MKKNIIYTIVLLISLSIMFSGCVYLDVQTPLDKNYDKTDLDTKIGKADAKMVMGLFAWGDAGTKAAADNGGIKIIKHADTELFQIFFGLYSKRTTVVYGD